MAKKLISDPISARLTRIWANQIFFMSFISDSSKTLLEPIVLRNLKET